MTEEGKKDEEKKTSLGSASTEDKNNSQAEDDTSQKTNDADDGTEVVSSEELKTLRNKARDFDGIADKEARKKFFDKHTNSDEKPAINVDEIVAKAKEEALETFRNEQKAANMEVFKGNLGKSIDTIVKEYDFLDSKALAEVNKNFVAGDALTEEQITAKLRATVQQSFPAKYEAALKSKLQNEILAEKGNIDLGGTGEGSSVHKEPQSMTEADKMNQKFKDNLPPGFNA